LTRFLAANRNPHRVKTLYGCYVVEWRQWQRNQTQRPQRFNAPQLMR
jgi:hypothetical protein